MSLAMFATPALAQSGTDAYNAIKPEVIQQDNGTGDNTNPPKAASKPECTSGNSSSSGSNSAACKTVSATKAGNELPFTGLDVGLVAAAGAALLGAGAGMRRLTRAPDAA